MLIWFDGEQTNTENTNTQTNTQNTQTQTNVEVKAPVFDDNFDFSGVIPADLKEDKTVAKFATHKGKAWVENVARSLVSAQGMIGADPNELVRLPADPTKITPQERGKVFDRLGLPKDEKAWALKPVEKPIAGFEPDGELGKWFSKAAREAGIFPDQAQGLYGQYVEQMRAAMEKQAAGFAKVDKDNIDSLQRELGQAFDDTIKASRYGAMKLGGEEFVNLIGNMGLGTDPVFVKAMAKYGKVMGEGSDGGDKPDYNNGVTPSAAKAEGDRLLREAMEIMDTNPAKARELNAKAQEYFAKAV